MKTWADAAQAAIEAGTAIAHGALFVGCAPTPLAIWSGRGALILPDSETYAGNGDHTLMFDVGQQIGGSEQALSLSLSGVDAVNLAMLGQSGLSGAPVRLWKLIFDRTGVALDAQLYAQGTLDQLAQSKAENGTYTLDLTIEGAVRGSGRVSGRLAAGVDQRLITGASDDGSLDDVSSAGSVTLYWGGKPPAQASTVANVQGAADLALEQF